MFYVPYLLFSESCNISKFFDPLQLNFSTSSSQHLSVATVIDNLSHPPLSFALCKLQVIYM